MQNTDTNDQHALDHWQSPHKIHYTVNDKNELIFKSPQLNKEFKLGPVAQADVEQLTQNFINNFNSINEVYIASLAKWNEAEDKLSVKGDIQHLTQLLHKSPSIGELEPILTFATQAENDIQAIFAKNKAIKEQLVARAKELSQSSDWKETTELFKALQDEWKSSPEVSKPDYEVLNAQFLEYKNTFFNKRNEVFEAEHLENWDKKVLLCESAEALMNSIEWKATTDEYKKLFDEWKTIGNVTSPEKNEELWSRFNAARQHFFDRKNAHSEQIKLEQQDNLTKKLVIIEKAEELAQSTQWKETQEMFEKLQVEWDAIGRVPQELSDETWSRWRKAKDTFFEAKKKFNKDYLQTLNDNYAKKQALTLKAEELSQQNQWRQITDALANLLEEWKTIGPIPREHGDELWNRFNEARRVFFKRKDADREKRKHQIEEKVSLRIQQTQNFLDVLKKELQDDTAQLAEFKSNIANIDGENKKDLELKKHLQHLIQQLERQIEKRTKKIEDVTHQLAELKKNDEAQ